MCGFIAQLVEHRTGIAEVMGSNPVEALIFFRLLLSNCLNWNIYCDDHTSLSRFFYVLYSDKTWVFDQSERAQGPIYIIKLYILPLKQNPVELNAKLQMDKKKTAESPKTMIVIQLKTKQSLKLCKHKIIQRDPMPELTICGASILHDPGSVL